MRKKKFILGENIKPLKPETEAKALNILLESVLREEKYEVAVLIRSRLETINKGKE